MVIDGLSAVIGSWKTIEMLLPRIRDSSASEAESRLMPRNNACTALDAAGWRRNQSQERLHRDALAATGFADNRQHLTAVEREAHVAHRLDLAGVGVKGHAEILDGQDIGPSASELRIGGVA